MFAQGWIAAGDLHAGARAVMFDHLIETPEDLLEGNVLNRLRMFR